MYSKFLIKAIRNTGKEHGQWGLAVPDIEFPMMAIRSTKK